MELVLKQTADRRQGFSCAASVIRRRSSVKKGRFFTAYYELLTAH